MKMIDVDTKLVALLGKPLEHSFSPQMHNSTFRSMDLNYYYFPIEVGKDNLSRVMDGIRYMNFAGFNVTKPHKVRVLEELDDIEDLAEKIGAVNTVVNIDGKLKGYNTDGSGFIRSFKDKFATDLNGKKYVILGAGGAGRSIAFNLANNGAEKIVIFDQYLYCSCKVVAELNERVQTCATYMEFKDKNLKEEINNCDVLINATGVGMYPDVDDIPIAKELLHENLIVSDITYNPLQTKFLEEAEEIGCKTLNGIGMLIHQGAEAFELWTGIDAPTKKMTEVVCEIIKNKQKS